ncbi:MAG: PRD domain-containing protein [Erysipelothrix sp.]|nr:PRD domain-containing protein [Erysipelothrix sp.]
MMHIINGINPQLDNKSNILTDAILGCLNVIRDYYLISLKPEELTTQRILVHIKLLLQRIIMGTQVDFKEQILYNVFEDFPSAYNCALEIQNFIEKRLNAKINQQEIVYLTIHLNRLEMMSK